MPPKARIPAPIDRPLSRAYLRQFTGWSTAYPPGISEPTSLRIMENVQINRDGSCRVRPGMRYISFDYDGGPLPYGISWVGSHEAFYLDDGRKAYLFYVRMPSGELEPRVLVYDETAYPNLVYRGLTHPDVSFDLFDGGMADLRFTPATTYVKYLQIDNKIFALSNAGEPMKMFYVGEGKWAKGLRSIEVPSWTVEDKPIVVHPDASWINGTSPKVYRENLIKNSSFENNVLNWTAADAQTVLGRATTDPHFDSYHGKITNNTDGTWIDSSVTAGAWIRTTITTVKPNKLHELSGFFRHETWADWGVKKMKLAIEWLNGSGEPIEVDYFHTKEMTTSYARFKSGLVRSPDRAKSARIYIKFLDSSQTGDTVFVDGLMFEQTSQAGRPYFDAGRTPPAGETYVWVGDPYNSVSQSTKTIGTWDTQPSAETPTTDTLISSVKAENIYSFGYFYTFYNEIGESAPSQVKVVKAQRPWPAWFWESANGSGEPSGTEVTDADLAADQLVVSVPEQTFLDAIDQGAIGWNLYMLTWSDQDSVPVEAQMIGQTEFDESTTWQANGWMRHSPEASDWPFTMGLPNGTNRFNFSDPSRGGQGLVAADRMVVVYDPHEAARIRWSSNQQGSYTDFSANKGGGYKTLTSGNLYVPAAVKLWQNPQSVDTLTILCMGTDGQSTGYYMAPAQVASQTDTANIMGFEETTATPGTSSPYGCEVFNNSLYHPLDEMLMKSTASNYNINHKTITEQIDDVWTALVDKHHIVSSQHDGRLYYIVNNPGGAALEDGCWGNEIWVFDAGGEKNGTWSRWLIQAQSLRKVEHEDQTYMSVVRPDGLYILDPFYDRDDSSDGDLLTASYIPWKLETNTQGANRAHDAWCHLQQMGIVLGNWQGSLRYGIRGWDINGKPVEISKIFTDNNPVSADGTKFDIEDQLLIRRDMKEWFFFAQSVTADELQ